MTETHAKRLSRREALALGGSALSIGLAGCATDTRAASHDGPVAVASFFTFYDFARQVAEGTPILVKNLIPTGLHGHGWEPDPSIQVDIITADAFIHVGPGFQPWADRAIKTARDDRAETEFIDVRQGIDLLDLADSVGEEEEIGRGKDPHFWLDPERAKESVDNIRDGLERIAPDEAAVLAENAEAVKAELDVLDDEWRSLVDAAERDVTFLAAHNAFEYVGDRYGVTLRPLVTNLAANNDVRPADMQRAQDTIADNDIRHIGAAVFEPRRPAEQLLAETSVEGYYPVTPYAGITERWAERNWGYFDIARQINMQTFGRLLDAQEPSEAFEAEWRNFE